MNTHQEKTAELKRLAIEILNNHYTKGRKVSVYCIKQRITSVIGYFFDWELALWMLEEGFKVRYDVKEDRVYCYLAGRSMSRSSFQKNNRQYAKDMGIACIERPHDLTEAQARENFLKAWRKTL